MTVSEDSSRRSGRIPHPHLLLVVLVGTALVIGVVIAVVALWSADRGRQGGSGTDDAGLSAPGTAVSFAVVGDSITEAGSPDINAGVPAAGSWTYHATGDGTRFVGGWARSGATTLQMAEGVAGMQADCLVVLAGTNDIAQVVPFEESAAHLRSIVSTSGLGTIIVSAVPPFDPDPQAAVRYNRELVDLAASEGWIFTDPMEGVRTGDRFRSSLSGDGVHPTTEGARIIGENLRAEILRVAQER